MSDNPFMCKWHLYAGDGPCPICAKEDADAEARADFDAACKELAEFYESIHSTLMNTHAGSHELRTASLGALDRFKRTYDAVHGKDKHDER